MIDARWVLIGALLGCDGTSHPGNPDGGNGDGGGDAPADLFDGEATITVHHPFGLAIADVDGNGTGDVLVGTGQDVATDPTIVIHFASTNRTFTPTGYAAGSSVTTMILADVDTDGTADLLTGSSGKLSVDVLHGIAGGTFATPSIASPTSATTSNLALASYDAGTTVDLVVGPTGQDSNAIAFVPGNGDGSFGTAIPIAIGTRTDELLTADWNSDGRPDLAVSSFIDDNVIPLLGNGDGTFTAKPTVSVQNPGDIKAADLDGDGNPDIVALAAGKIYVALGAGDGTFAVPMQFSAGTAIVAFVLADLDGDGKPDAIVEDGVGDKIQILLGLGDGRFAPKISVPFVNARALAVGDVDGDGHPDLAVIGDTADTVLVMFGKN